ncbi:MAG: tetratricopeptide repeat protein [Myxococcales bacterium]|nr:tetratricopeptide repeat protein [Myxococcales bacterium]
MSRTIERQTIIHHAKLLWVFLCVLCCWGTLGNEAHAQEGWKLRDRTRRQQQILRRFQQIVEKKPDRGFAFQRMIQLGRRWPGLDRLVAEYRKKAKRSPKRLAYHLILGHLLHRTGQKVGALAAYEAALKLSPRYELAHLYRAQILRDLQRYPDAFKAYEETLKISKSSDTRRRCLKSLGTLALLMKQPKRALAYWKRFLRESPNNLLAREELARAMGRYKLYKEAMEQWKEVLKRRRGGVARAGVLRQIGALHEDEGKWQEAVKVYRQAMALTQQGHWLRRELGARVLQLHRENGKLAELAVYLQKQRRKSAADYAALAQLYDELGRDKEARKAYTKALSANPRDTRLRLKFITLLEVGGDTKEGISQYRLLIRYEPGEPRYRMAFAEMLSRAGKQKESLDEMAAIAKRFSRNTEILSRLAALYRRRRMHKEANALLRRLMRVDPRDPSHRNALGAYYFGLGQTAKARSIWKGILRSGLGTAAAYTALGQIYRTHSLERDALDAFRRASRAKPKDLGLMRNYGEMFRRLLEEDGEMNAKDLKEAIVVWTKIHKSSKLRRQKKDALRQLFAFYHAQGTLYRLPADYLARLRKRPSDVEAMRFLGEYYLWQAQKEQRDNAQAKRYFERILNFQKNDLDAILTLERLEARNGRWYLAKKYLLKAVTIDKKGRRLYYRRLYGYSLKLRQYEEAIRYGQRVVELHPEDATAHAELARIYRRSGRIREAISSYQEAVRLQPHNYGYHQVLGHLYRDQGDTNKAIERYMFVLKNAKEGGLIYDATLQVMTLRPVRRENDILEVTLQTLSERNPREIAYFRALAELYRRQGRMKEYRVAYLKAAATVDQKSQVYKKLAESAQEQGNISKAIIYFRKMLEETPNPSADQQIHLAELYLQVSDQKSARKLLLAILTEHPNSVRTLLQVARIFERNQLVDEAIYSYELFLELQPMEHQVRMSLAQLYLRKQHLEPAMGLLESVFWLEKEKALRKVASKVRKAKKPKKNVPAYLRRHRYFSYRYGARHSRYQRRRQILRSRPLRMQALEMLLGLYARTDRMSEWYRRVFLRLRRSVASGDEDFTEVVTLLRRYYITRQQQGSLRLMYEALHAADPSDARWSHELAQIYADLGMTEKAMALMRMSEGKGGHQSFQMSFAKLQLLVKLRDETRLRFLLRDMLYGTYSRNYTYMSRVLSELQRLPKKTLYRSFLKGLMRWGGKGNLSTYQQMLVSFYLRRGMQEEARKELWRRWIRYSAKGDLSSMQRERSQTLRILWPLLHVKEQETLVREAEQRVTDTVLLGDTAKIRRALVDAQAVMAAARGKEAAQAYLPALWGVARGYRDRSFRRSVLHSLLQERNDEAALTLIKQELVEITSRSSELGYIYALLLSLKNRGGSPSDKLGKFVEQVLRRVHAKDRVNTGQSRSLRAVQSKTQEKAWLAVALRLGELYLEWGETRRSIWWLEACRWLDRKHANEPDLLRALYEAYREQGMPKVAERYRVKLIQEIRQIILSGPQGWLRYHQKKPNRSQALYQHAWSFWRSRLGYSLQRRVRMLRFRSRARVKLIASMPLLQSYKTRIAPLVELYSEAGEIDKLAEHLRALKLRAATSSTKRMYELYLLGAYLWDWEARSAQESLQVLLDVLPRVLRYPLTQKQRFDVGMTYGHLLAEGLQYKKAIAYYKTMFSQLSPRQEQTLLRRIAELASRLSMEDEEFAAYTQLANKFKDSKANLLLAERALSKKQVFEAIRYYTIYVREDLKSSRYRYLPPQIKKAELHIRLASFLLGAGFEKEGLFRLQRALDTLRLERNQAHYQLRMRIQQILSLYRQAGKLRERIAEWEKARQGNQAQDVYLLTLLQHAYQTLGEKDRRFNTLSDLLKLQPYDKSLFYVWKSSYENDASKEQRKTGLAFLRALYADPKPKPEGYYLFLGGSFLSGKQKDQALASLKKAMKNCAVRANNLTISRYRRSYMWMRCVRAVGIALLKGGFLGDYVKIAKELFQKEANSQIRTRILVAISQDLLTHKAHAQLLELLSFAKFPLAVSLRLDTDKIELWGAKLQAHKALNQEKDYWATLFALLEFPTSSSYTSIRIARVLADTGALLGAEVVLWRALRQATAYQERNLRVQLCTYWRRGGLGSLCGLDLASKLSKAQAHALAKRSEGVGLPFAAMLLRRRAWLKLPRDLSSLDALARSSASLGRKDDTNFLLRLRKRWFASAVASMPKISQTTASQVSAQWSLKVPSYCGRLSVKDGKLQTADCSKRWAIYEQAGQVRCLRRIVRAGGLVVTNDCRGHLVALDAKKGRVQWVKQVVTFKSREVVTWKNRQPKMWLDRNLHIADIQEDGDDLLVAFNEIWFEWGSGWISGVQHQLHFAKISKKDGSIRMQSKLPGNYVRQGFVVAGDLMLFRGRSLHAFSKTTGKLVWTRHTLGTQGTWLLDSTGIAPLVVTQKSFCGESDGFLRCFNLQDGKELWSKRLRLSVRSMAQKGSTLLAMVSDSTLFAFHLEDGKLLWKKALQGASHRYRYTWWPGFFTPFRRGEGVSIQGNEVVVYTAEGHVKKLDLGTGKSRWQRALGDMPWYRPVYLPKQRAFLVVGQLGTASALSRDDGHLLWSLRFAPLPNSSSREQFRHLRPLLLGDRVLLASYTSRGDFVLRVRSLEQNLPSPREQRLLKFVQTLRQEKRQVWADTLLSYAADPYHSRSRPFFSQLSTSTHITKEQRMLWVLAQLRHAPSLKEKLLQLEPLLRRLRLKEPSSYFSTYNKREVETYLANFLLYGWTVRKKEVRSFSYWWNVTRYAYRSVALDSPLSRRVLALLMKEGSKSVRWWSALLLASWGDGSGRRLLLAGLTPSHKMRLNLSSQIQKFAMRLLASWSYNLRWTGLLERGDLPYVQPLLKARDIEIRTLAAVFTAWWLVKDRPEEQRFDSKRLRRVLKEFENRRSLSSFRRNSSDILRVLSNFALAQLGSRAGIEGLRVLVRSGSGMVRNRSSRLLFSTFSDYSGKDAIFESVKGTNQGNLRLPSFQFIYANNLLEIKEYLQAYTQFLAVFKMPKQLLSPVHRAKAAWGCAKALTKLGRVAEAKTWLAKAIAFDPPRQYESGYLRGMMELKLGHQEEANKYFRRYLRDFSLSDRASEIRGRLALAALKKGQLQEALGLFSPVFERDKGMRRLHIEYFHLAKAILDSKPSPEIAQLGLKHIRMASKLREDFPRYLAVEAQLLFLLGKRKQAIQRMARAIRLEAPRSPYKKEFLQKMKGWGQQKLGQRRRKRTRRVAIRKKKHR